MTQYPPPPAPAGYSTAPAGEPPLDQPWYGASFLGAWKRFWKKYATFTGRASLSEFWWTVLANTIVFAILGGLTAVLGLPGSTTDPATNTLHLGGGSIVGMILYWLFGLALIVPMLAIYWRRLHDTGRSGGWWFIVFVPFVGGIILLVFVLLPSRPEGARFDA
jgi:uncharacterized membrane protein YhaH (DUF805 family)